MGLGVGEKRKRKRLDVRAFVSRHCSLSVKANESHGMGLRAQRSSLHRKRSFGPLYCILLAKHGALFAEENKFGNTDGEAYTNWKHAAQASWSRMPVIFLP